MKKRILSVLLAMCMMLTLLPGEAIAAELDEVEEVLPVEEAVAPEEDEVEEIPGEVEKATPEEIPVEDAEEEGGEVASEDVEEDAEEETAELMAVDSGVCGDNLTWMFDESTGVLTISGTGDMYDYRGSSGSGVDAPWKSYLRTPKIRSVVIQSGITAIGKYAFYNCTNIISISIPESVTRIREGAFRACENLSIVNIPQRITSVESYVFYNCKKLTDITLPHGLTAIGDYAFWFCGFSDLTIPDNVTSIGRFAFAGCSSLGALELPDSVVSIGEYAFSGCRGFTSFDIPAGIKSIPTYLLEGCTNLTRITLHEGLVDIGECAFWNCQNLADINIPDGVISIGKNAFFGCYVLSRIDLPESIDSIGDGAFSTCYQLAHITLPKTLSYLGSGAFGNCYELTSFTIPQGVGVVGQGLFSGCKNLDRISVPKSVYKIESGAFRTKGGYSNGITIYFAGSLEEWEQIDISVLSGLDDVVVVPYCYGISEDGFVQRVPYADENIEFDSDSYYKYPAQRLFRIRPVGCRLPCDAGFEVKVGENTFTSGWSTCSSTDDVKAVVPPSYTGDIVFSKEGYHTNSIPARLAGATNHVIMTPASVTDVFVNTLLVSSGTRNYPKFVNAAANLQGSELSVFEPGMSSPTVEREYYVSINWNGHGEGTVWLEQGDQKIELADNASRSFAIEETFVAGKPVYLCAKAGDGTLMKLLKTSINIRARTNDGVMMGMGASAAATINNEQGQDSLDIIAGQTFELDFSALSDDLIPCKFEISRDGTVKGTIGLEMPEGKYSEAAYGKIKETYAKLKDSSQLMSNINTSKDIAEIEKMGKLAESYGKVGTSAKLQIVGCFSGSLVNGEFRISELSIILIVSGSLSYEYNWVATVLAIPVPLYFKIALGVKLQTAINLKYAEQIKRYMPDDSKLSAGVSLTVEGGVGREYAASLGGKGTGTIGIETILPGTAEDMTMTFGANLSAVGTILGISGEWELVKLTDMVIWEDGKPAWRRKESTAALYGLEPEFTPDLELTAMTFTAREGGDIIAAGVSGYAAPSLMELEDGRLLAVWTADVPGRSGLDKNGLYYSVRDTDGSWSNAQVVWNDGTNDSLPALWQAGNEVWLTWQNYTRTYSMDSLEGVSYEELAGQINIAAAKFNSGTNAFAEQMNIPCAGYGCRPQIVWTDGVVSAAWQDLDGAQWSSTYDETSGWAEAVKGDVDWYAPEAKLPSTYTEEAPAAAMQTFATPEYQAILYTAENEEGIANVYGLFNDGFGWGEPLQLTDASGCSVGGFSAVISEDGTVRILTDLVYRDAEGAYQSADLALYEVMPFSTVDLAVGEVDYVHDTLAPGGTLTVTADVTNRSAKTVSGLTAEVNGVSGDHQVTLLPGQTKTVYLNYPLGEVLPDQLAVTIQPQNETDADSVNDCGVCMLENVDLSLEEVIAEQTEDGTALTAMVVNRGSTDIAGYTITYRRDTPDGEIILTQTFEDSIPAGDAVYAGSTAGTLEPGTMVYAEAALLDAKAENLYGNNTDQAVVVGSSQDNMGVSAAVKSTGADGTVVQITDPYGALSGCTEILAAVYDDGGRMLNAAAGRPEEDGTISFSKRVEAGWTLFLLDKDGRPVYEKIVVE